MTHVLATDHRTPVFVPPSPVQASPQHPASDQSRDTHRAFDYGVGYGHRSGYSSRRYADVPGRGLFHCG